MNAATATSHTSRKWHHEPHIGADGELTGAITIGEEWSYTRQMTMINPGQRNDHRGAFVLWFGAYGWTRLHVYADCLNDALEQCAKWLAEHAPGHIMAEWGKEHTELVRELCEEMGLAYPPSDGADMEPYWQAEESAVVDQTRTESGFIASWEWGVALEDPTVAELYDYVCGK